MNFDYLIEDIKKIKIRNHTRLMRDILCIRTINYDLLNHIIHDHKWLFKFTKEMTKKQLVSEFKMIECKNEPDLYYKASMRYDLFKYLSSYENIKIVLKAMKKFNTMNMYYLGFSIYLPSITLINLERIINENGSYLDYFGSIKYWIEYICPAIIMDPHIQYNSLIP